MSFFQRVFRKKLDIQFFCGSPIDEIWIRSTAFACHSQDMSVRVDICGKQESLPQDIRSLYSSAGLGLHFHASLKQAAGIAARLVVTASSGIDRKFYPTAADTLIHMPHSLASLHMIYPEDAFDGYDILFAAGPHHEKEFHAITAARNLKNQGAMPIGYGKLDILAEQHTATYQKDNSGLPHILVAPSWGPDNLLDRCGLQLAEELSKRGYKVTIRPHPLFILEQAAVLEELHLLAQTYPTLAIESPFDGDGAIFNADLLIGDYSGASFEFKALRGRPVISVNVGKKVINPHWDELGLPPVEIALRGELGPTVEPDVGAILHAVIECAGSTGETSDSSSFVYGPPGSCCQRASAALGGMLRVRP